MQVRSERGQTMTEYAVLLTLVFLVVVGIIALFGPKIAALFDSVRNAL